MVKAGIVSLLNLVKCFSRLVQSKMLLRSGTQTNPDEMHFNFNFVKKRKNENAMQRQTKATIPRATTSQASASEGDEMDAGNPEAQMQQPDREIRRKFMRFCCVIVQQIPSVLGLIGGLFAIHQLFFKNDSSVKDGDVLYVFKNPK